MSRSWSVTLRIDTSATSAYREYPVTNLLSIGHAWLTVEAPSGHRVDIGYYPDHTALQAPGMLVVGDLGHVATQDAAYKFPVSADQAARLLTAAEATKADPGVYHGLINNCLTVAHDLMTHAGIEMPPLPRGIELVSPEAPLTAHDFDAARLTAHDPAIYNTILNGTVTGQGARALYDGSTDKSDGNALDRLAPLRTEAERDASQEHATYIELDDPPVQPGTYIELDDPTEPPGTYIELDDLPPESGTYIELDDPTEPPGTYIELDDPTEPPETYIELDEPVHVETDNDPPEPDPDLDMQMGGRPH